MIGSRLSHFEIVAVLGKGGMGEVYRARDTRLGRSVAVKVLPAEFTSDPGRLARFEREARVLASLNHPNIAAIHQVEEAEGMHFLVMELVEGEDLATRLARGALPVGEALELARRVAEGLEAAHRMGVVHRDLKPPNLMIGVNDQVKILDFGLAKVVADAAGSDADLTQSPTLTAQMTRAGTVLGTAAYMSPEQTRGQEVDARTDIWALGAVLYEMLTGRRAFRGKTATDLIAAILEREPDWTALPPATPQLARTLLRRCLQKDPRRRVHDVADVRIELEEASRELAGPVGPEAPEPERFPSMVARSLIALALVGLGAFAGWAIRRPSAPPAVIHGRFHLRAPDELLAVLSGPRLGGAESSLAISPDGRWVAFRGWDGGEARLYLRAVEALEAHPVPGSEQGYNPFFSPDSRWLGFLSRGALRRISTTGGAPLTICEIDQPLRGASWGEDDTILFGLATVGEASGLFRVAAEGGEPELITGSAPAEGHRWPDHLPERRGVVFQIHRGIGEASNRIAVLSSKTGETRTLVRGGSYPRYAAGHLFFSRQGTLYAAPFDLDRLELTAEPIPVLDDVLFYPGSYQVGYDLSITGSLVYSPGSPRPVDGQLVEIDRDGTVSGSVARRAAYTDFSLSPSGRRLAAVVQSGIEETDLWVYEFSRDSWTQLTLDGAPKAGPTWAPDERTVLFSQVVDGSPKLFRIRADGSTPAEQLTFGLSWDWMESVSPDGRLALFSRDSGEESGWDLYTLEIGSGREPLRWAPTTATESDGKFSPDGHWVAYTTSQAGRSDIYARPYPGGEPRVRISTAGGGNPRWSPTGREIFYICDEAICAVPVERGTELRLGSSRRLSGLERLELYDVFPDGQRFLVRQAPPEPTTRRDIVYVPAWVDELSSQSSD